MIKLFFLGSPRIVIDDREIHLTRKKSIALLAYTAVSEVRLSRSQICGILWPEKDESHARSALRTTLSTLNSDAGETLINSDSDYFSLSEGIEVDVEVFREKVKSLGKNIKYDAALIKDLQQAASIYTGDFLSGFNVKNETSQFEDWQFMHCENLRKSYGSVLERLVQLFTLISNFKEATKYAALWSDHEPDNEHTHRRLMELYAWQGRKRDAMRQYERCKATLERELGLEPEESTVRLYESIRENRLEIPAGTNGDIQEIPHEQVLDNSVFYSTVLSIGHTNTSEKIIVQRPYDTASMVDILFHNNIESILKKNNSESCFIIGDSIISLFGIPNSTGEDAYHALMAAIEIIQTASTYGFVMTAAIASGLVYYKESSLIGPAVTEANLMRFYGEPGMIFAENATWTNIKNAAVFEKQDKFIPGISRTKDIYMLKTGMDDYRLLKY